MTLANRIKLIDDMIRENPDATIGNYLELCKELGSIAAAAPADPIIILKQVEQEIMEPKKRRPWGSSKMRSKYLRTFKIG
jgi:hypothetical protein